MNVRQVLFVCNPSQPNAAQTAQRLADFLRKKGLPSQIIQDYHQIKNHPGTDLCVSLGGDGTTLRCARETAPLGVPVLAVNCGSLGFLSACEEKDAPACLERILDGHFQISRRLLLCADIERAGQAPLRNLLAFNDCVIKTVQPRAFSLRFLAGKLELKRYYGDGVIISTPAGSTAYSLAAGGPIVEPDLNVLVITPLCPHSLTERPLLVRAGEEWAFSPVFKNPADRAVASLDGQENYELQNGDRVILRRSAHEAQLICAGNFDFFTRLRAKLEWGERDAS